MCSNLDISIYLHCSDGAWTPNVVNHLYSLVLTVSSDKTDSNSNEDQVECERVRKGGRIRTLSASVYIYVVMLSTSDCVLHTCNCNLVRAQYLM